MTNETYRRVDTEDGDGNPFHFTGRVLGHASSKKYDDQLRWTEVTIFLTQGGNYVLETIGQSVRPGEVVKQRAHVLEDPVEVITKLHQTDAMGTSYLTYTSREALFQAMAEDRRLDDAWLSRSRAIA